MKNEQKIRAIWNNSKDRRYIVAAYHSNTTGWGVYDQAERKFVDDKISDIDPAEPLAKS